MNQSANLKAARVAFDGWGRSRAGTRTKEAWESLFGGIAESKIEELGRRRCEEVAVAYAMYMGKFKKLAKKPTDPIIRKELKSSEKKYRKLLKSLVATEGDMQKDNQGTYRNTTSPNPISDPLQTPNRFSQ